MALFNLRDMVFCIQVFNESQDLTKQKVFTNQRTKREWKNKIPNTDPAHLYMKSHKQQSMFTRRNYAQQSINWILSLVH
jgi:hypothetical protein